MHLKAKELIENGELPPMILVMPSDGLWGDGSAYLQHNGYNFEKWITEDVVDAVVESIDGADSSSPLFISGLSMGGFGALRIGAKYGSRFKAMSGLSSMTSLPQMKLFVEEQGAARDNGHPKPAECSETSPKAGKTTPSGRGSHSRRPRAGESAANEAIGPQS